MGAGKTSVGRVLAAQLGWIFQDLDQLIEQREGRTVAEIFRDSGEEQFRVAESTALRDALLASSRATIVALGGGAFPQPSNVALITSRNVPTVFLDASVEELWRRCAEQSANGSVERPLQASAEQFRKLYQARLPHYAKASLRIETGGKTVEAIAREIAQGLRLTSY